MILIFAQKHMNLPKSIALTCCGLLAFSGNGVSAKASEMRVENRTFADWCRDKDSLSPETNHTIELLLKEAGTTECDAANQKLSSLTELNLKFKGISDIKPLESLTKLTVLFLYSNDLSDIKPLESLTNIMSDRLTIISRPGGFLRLEIVGRYCWRTLPYLISGEAKRRESTGHDIT